MEFNFWLTIGIILILWALYDLYSGKVWIHREVERAYEPGLYWISWGIWAIIAVVVIATSI